MAKLLVVDDEPSIGWGLRKLGEGMGHSVQTAASAEEGLRLAAADPPDLLVLDVRLPGMDGLTALEQFRRHAPDASVIVMTAFGGLDTAVKAVRAGAMEYLLKPFDLAVARAAVERALRSAKDALPAVEAAVGGEMLGETPVMQALYKQIALAAASDANVVVRGESGVGKELAARAIHRYSGRAGAVFVPVNAAALSPSIAESELFGHVDGAFTGASRSREGLLVRADGGTLFLDEAAEIPLSLQVKLLRAIEEGEVLPVGADRPASTRFRVVAATHQDLRSRVQAGAFRHDFYFRLCAFEVEVPPLRERADDIPLLASHFAYGHADSLGLSFADETIDELRRRPWYGNVRELRNAVEHAAVVARAGVILPEHLPPEQPRLEQGGAGEGGAPSRLLAEAASSRSAELLDDPVAEGALYETMLEELERPMLSRVMTHFANECAPAARALGLHRTTLKRKLVELGIEGE